MNVFIGFREAMFCCYCSQPSTWNPGATSGDAGNGTFSVANCLNPIYSQGQNSGAWGYTNCKFSDYSELFFSRILMILNCDVYNKSHWSLLSPSLLDCCCILLIS